MIERVYVVRDRDSDILEDENGDTHFNRREQAEELARYVSDPDEGAGSYGPYAVTVQVPGPGGWRETRACSTYEDGNCTWTTNVYEDEMVPA